MKKSSIFGCAPKDSTVSDIAAGPSQSLTQLLADLETCRHGFEKAVEADPQDRAATLNLARSLHHLGRSSQAVRVLQYSLSLGDPDIETLEFLGDVFQSTGHFKDASEQYQSCLSLQPTCAGLYDKLFMSMMAEERFEEINDIFENALVQGVLLDVPASAVHAGLRIGTTEFQKHMQSKAAEGIPYILVNSIPRSGSTYLATGLCLGMNVPQCYLSAVTHTLYAPPLQSAMEQFRTGGSLARQHWVATPELVESLKRHGVTRMILHVRDPRQAMVSAARTGPRMFREASREAHIQTIMSSGNPFAPRSRYTEPLSVQYGKMLSSWLEIHETDPDFDIFFSNFETLSNEPQTAFNQILDFLGIDRGAFDFSRVPQKEKVAYFRKGSSTEWLEALSEQQLSQIEADVPEHIWEYFGWERVASSV